MNSFPNIFQAWLKQEREGKWYLEKSPQCQLMTAYADRMMENPIMIYFLKAHLALIGKYMLTP